MDLIDRDELLKRFELTSQANGNAIRYEIKCAPTVDAEPVRHGKWYTAEKYNGYLYWNCDQCHKHFTSQKSNYCPNCGAKMDAMDGDEQ